MRAAVRQGVGVAVLALAALVPGCKKEREPEPPSPAPVAEPTEGRPGGPKRVGVKVPMPPGWSAQVANDGSFQFGPPGRAVLRVDLRPGQGETLPSPDELAESMLAPFKSFHISFDQEEEGKDYSLVQVTLAPRLEDGGLGADYPALFGARRVGPDLFLCATLPDASSEEVRQAAEACRGIEFQPPR